MVAELAAKLVSMQSSPLRTERKDPLYVVTEADLAAEEIVVSALMRLTPDAAIPAEECVADAGMPAACPTCRIGGWDLRLDAALTHFVAALFSPTRFGPILRAVPNFESRMNHESR